MDDAILVKIETFADRRLFLDREERGTLAERRQNCSMIAFISDCPRAQQLLPLILLLNDHHVTKNVAQPIVDEFAGDRNVVFFCGGGPRGTVWISWFGL